MIEMRFKDSGRVSRLVRGVRVLIACIFTVFLTNDNKASFRTHADSKTNRPTQDGIQTFELYQFQHEHAHILQRFVNVLKWFVEETNKFVYL